MCRLVLSGFQSPSSPRSAPCQLSRIVHPHRSPWICRSSHSQSHTHAICLLTHIYKQSHASRPRSPCNIIIVSASVIFVSPFFVSHRCLGRVCYSSRLRLFLNCIYTSRAAIFCCISVEHYLLPHERAYASHVFTPYIRDVPVLCNPITPFTRNVSTYLTHNTPAMSEARMYVHRRPAFLSSDSEAHRSAPNRLSRYPDSRTSTRTVARPASEDDRRSDALRGHLTPSFISVGARAWPRTAKPKLAPAGAARGAVDLRRWLFARVCVASAASGAGQHHRRRGLRLLERAPCATSFRPSLAWVWKVASRFSGGSSCWRPRARRRVGIRSGWEAAAGSW